MIVVDARARTNYLKFPNAYTLLLPERAGKGERLPFVLCLHDLGQDRWQCMREMDAQELVERLGIALVLPEGRYSCFLNMAHGPCWNDYLGQELPAQLCHTFALDREKTGVLGAGAGALGALELAKKGIPCALAEPGISDALTCGSRYWPNKAQWCGALKGREADWQPSRWQAVQGVMAGSKKALDDAERTLGLSHWKKLYCEADAGKSWEAALTQLAARMETQGRTPAERI